MSLPSSPRIQKRSSIPTPWNNIYLPMCNMKRSGDISMHCLSFHGFLKDDNRFFKFIVAMNDHILMGDIKSNPNAKVNWSMPNTKEYYNFKGKFYIASAPIQVTRFPPPKIMDDDCTAQEYWEEQRIQQWQELDQKTRAVFTWPSRAEVPKANNIAFSCQSLNDDTSIIHDIAMDNFCLLVYKVTDVEYFDYSCYPPKRRFYTYSLKSNSWDIQTSNP
ncbi:hypothetical protein MFLAVUS_003084 [Mucor flavus]|uniref:Uncharacterized protein n=1 Tax=Mucor flavus TaxID=439312 RepID=A0ABP9YS39_9FUNG